MTHFVEGASEIVTGFEPIRLQAHSFSEAVGSRDEFLESVFGAAPGIPGAGELGVDCKGLLIAGRCAGVIAFFLEDIADFAKQFGVVFPQGNTASEGIGGFGQEVLLSV